MTSIFLIIGAIGFNPDLKRHPSGSESERFTNIPTAQRQGNNPEEYSNASWGLGIRHQVVFFLSLPKSHWRVNPVNCCRPGASNRKGLLVIFGLERPFHFSSFPAKISVSFYIILSTSTLLLYSSHTVA